MRLTFAIQETVSNHITVKVPIGFGLVLPERGVTLRDAKSIVFEIFRAGVGLVAATRITKVQLVAAIFNPLMRFLPIPAAGAPVNIRIWVTFSNELPSNTKIRWRLPGFLGQSVEQIFLNTPFSYPPGMIPEASWLADDGTGAGVLIATVGSETVPANQNLRIEIPITSGIRLPANGTAACTEGDECSITIFCDATTGLLRPTIFRGLQVIEGPWDARGVTQGAIFQQQRQNATWDEATKRLSYEIRTSKDAGRGLSLVVGQAEGFRTPPDGIDLASSDLSKKLLISSDAVDGPVDPTVLDIAHMHPYLIHTTVGYNPPRAGTVAHLTFSVTTRTPFETGDIVRFTLANFTGGDWCWNSEEFMSSRCVLEKYSSTDWPNPPAGPGHSQI